MADAGEHVAPAGADRWLAWCADCAARISSQVQEALVPHRVPFHRCRELRGAAVVVAGCPVIFQSSNLPISQFRTAS